LANFGGLFPVRKRAVSVSIYEGRLIANIVYVEEFIAPQTMKAVAERFVGILASACRIDR
jgi:hypothetical protein